MTLNLKCILINGLNGRFYVMDILPQYYKSCVRIRSKLLSLHSLPTPATRVSSSLPPTNLCTCYSLYYVPAHICLGGPEEMGQVRFISMFNTKCRTIAVD